MARPHQEIRPSQFVITYGPGSIVETRSGPVVVRSMDRLFRHINRDPQDFEIVDDRLSRAELRGARIARLPTNAELGWPTDDPVYPTERFPFWALCIRHPPVQILHPASSGCPQCPPAQRTVAGAAAIRFVLACPAGHLDEVNWGRIVHPAGGTCRPDHFIWRGGGRALRHVMIECPGCQNSQNFGSAYGRPWPCTGRQPEIEQPRSPGCPEDARIMQRGAANLHMPLVASALTILDMPTRLHTVLKDRGILSAARVLRNLGRLDQPTFLGEMQNANLPQVTLDYLQRTPWNELRGALDQLLDQGSGTLRPVRDEEFDRLVRAATQGAPPMQPAIPTPGTPPLFEVRLSDVRRFHGPTGRLRFRVTPVSRLRMVMAQTGYQRLDPQTARIIDVSFEWTGLSWYPGVELFGEGIFIDLEGASTGLSGPRERAWQQKHANSPEILLHPVHVWWHSLAHRILTALSVDSGYSSTSIRERTYLTFDSAGNPLGGILLYTVQPGGDGTLGGLLSLVPAFSNILDDALRDVGTCSNDPLCAEAPSAGSDGAACYSCLLVSETSCEHRNRGLDRLLLMDNAP